MSSIRQIFNEKKFVAKLRIDLQFYIFGYNIKKFQNWIMSSKNENGTVTKAQTVRWFDIDTNNASVINKLHRGTNGMITYVIDQLEAE